MKGAAPFFSFSFFGVGKIEYIFRKLWTHYSFFMNLIKMFRYKFIIYYKCYNRRSSGLGTHGSEIYIYINSFSLMHMNMNAYFCPQLVCPSKYKIIFKLFPNLNIKQTYD